MLAGNDNRPYEDKPLNLSSNLSVHSSNNSHNSQVSHLINNIEEGMDKKPLSSSFIDDINMYPGNNSPFISKIDCDRFSNKGICDDKDYMGKKLYRNSFDSASEFFRVNNNDDDNIHISNSYDEADKPSYSNAIQLFQQKKY